MDQLTPFLLTGCWKTPICGIALILPRIKHGAGLLRRTPKYASLLRISGALHLGIFEQPSENDFSSRLFIYRDQYLRKELYQKLHMSSRTRDMMERRHDL